MVTLGDDAASALFTLIALVKLETAPNLLDPPVLAYLLALDNNGQDEHNIDAYK